MSTTSMHTTLPDAGAPRTRDELREMLLALMAPAVERMSPGRARVRLGPSTAHYSQAAAEIEGFTRLLWGLVPLAASGDTCSSLPAFVEGLANGTDPNHPEFWGVPEDYDSRLVEAAAVGYALALAGHAFWDPLPASARRNVSTWLSHANARTLYDNNWLFFRVLVNLGLRTVGEPFSEARLRADLDRLESFSLGDGWYSDGPDGPRDYYNAFVFHYDSLIYLRIAGADDPARAQRFRERAASFSSAFIHWFSPNGASVPYGRSLVYRFAQASFWSALALTDIEIVPWNVAKGLLLRHLRWWDAQPTRTEFGLLSVGYRYPNPHIVEQYVSPASPYWALKAFAALAADASHPFWIQPEAPLPDLPATTLQKAPRMILCRDGAHVVALAGGQFARSQPRHAAEKYAKFSYSTHFGFSVPSAHPGLGFAAPDGTLLLSDDREWLRGPTEPEAVDDAEDRLVTRWRPWRDVTVTTWLVPAGRWHLRVHRLVTARRLFSVEGGFAVDRDRGDELDPLHTEADIDCALIRSSTGSSIIRSSGVARRGAVHRTAPATNVLFARAIVPILRGGYEPGAHWLTCAVAGWPNGDITRDTPAPVTRHDDAGITLIDADGREMMRLPSSAVP